MKESAENQIERLLETPYCVIDFLPETVSAERSKQYFEVEEFCCNSQFVNRLYQQFAYVVIKLSCYFDIDGHPTPESILEDVNGCITNGNVNFLFADEDALITLNGGDLYMTVYNPDGRFLQLLQSLVASEGLFLRKS